MLVSNNSLLNILVSNDNKALKNALKEADVNTLKNMASNKALSNHEILKNLFDDLKNGAKSKTTIETMLKNSTSFKELGYFSKSLTTLLNQIDSQSNLSKYKSLLESFQKNIKDVDEKVLKEQISKSGVFLESKMAQAQNTKGSSLPSNIQKLLTQLQESIKNINSPLTKQLSEDIDKVLKGSIEPSKLPLELKTILSRSQTLNSAISSTQTKDLDNLTNQLKSLLSQATLLESKIENNPTARENLSLKEQINLKTKEILTQIRQEVVQSNSKQLDSNGILKQIDTLLKSNDLFSKNQNLIEPKSLLNNLLNSKEIVQASNQSSNISNLILNLKNVQNNIGAVEQKALNSQNIQSEKANLTQTLKENINQLKSELFNLKNQDIKPILPIIQKLETIKNIFAKIEIPVSNTTINNQANISTFSNNFASNLNTLILSLKENISAISPNTNSNLQTLILKTVDTIESALKENILPTQNQNLSTNPALNKAEANPISSDMKTILLQMSEELASKGDAKSQEMFKQVDKMLMQIDYHQLLSASSNSNYVYVPFLWEMLEDGSIQMKKIDEEKFYCQINLTLKDFGKVDLMLALYDKNKLDLTIYAQRENFKTAIRDNIQKLKRSLNSVELIPVNIKLLDLKEDQDNSKESTFEKHFDDSLGINIRA